MAEDFHAAFGLGRDAKSISPGDVGGVALAAIQGLDEKNERRIAQLEQENTELRERLDSLERVVRQLAAVR